MIIYDGFYQSLVFQVIIQGILLNQPGNHGMFLKVFSFSRLTAGEFLCFYWLDDLCLGLLKQTKGSEEQNCLMRGIHGVLGCPRKLVNG